MPFPPDAPVIPVEPDLSGQPGETCADTLLRRLLAQFDQAREHRTSLWLEVPQACRCGRALTLDLTELLEVALLRPGGSEGPCLVFHHPRRVLLAPSSPAQPPAASPEAPSLSRLEFYLTLPGARPFSPAGRSAEGLALIEARLDDATPLASQLLPQPDRIRATTAWSSVSFPCNHGEPIPRMPLGKRSVPQFCPRAREEGDLSLASVPRWPSIEACRECQWYRGDTELEIRCACPGVELGPSGMSLELDVYRTDGRKRRSFLALADPDAPRLIEQVRAIVRYPGANPAARVDVKYVEGRADWLSHQSDAYAERWRFYWNGEHWMRKPRGASLHDWNKWGRRLEHLSAASFGSMPPEGGWPPVLDLPPGRYKLRVLELRWLPGRKGERELEWVFRVLSGTFRGRRVFRRSPIRSASARQLLLNDLAMVLNRTPESLPSPEAPGFLPLLEQARGVGVFARIALHDDFLNLYLNRRLISARRQAQPGEAPTQSDASEVAGRSLQAMRKDD